MNFLLEPFRRTVMVLGLFSVGMMMAVSCLKELPETVPGKVEWNPSLAFPLGDDSFGLNSFSGFDTTLFDLDTITGLPGWVDEVKIVMEGSLDFSLSSINDNLEYLNSFLIRVNLYNGFPNEMITQAYFQDAGRNNIDSMFLEGPIVVPAGTPQGSGEVVNASFVQKDAVFDKERMQPLANARVIFFKATLLLSEVDSTLIPFYPSYHFDVSMGVMLDLSMEF